MIHVNSIILPKNANTLITSDIHGNLSALKKLLEKANFSQEDLLIINGDTLEKGPNSLDTLNYLYHLSRTHQVIINRGNCDILDAIKDTDNHQAIRNYMLTRKESIFCEIANVLSIPIHKNLDMESFAKQTLLHYGYLIDFVASFSHIIDCPAFVCVHAGLECKPYHQQNLKFLLETQFFAHRSVSFPKPVIVGHYPVCLYHNNTCNYNPILDVKRNIYSIDGGNIVNTAGQLNALIYNKGNYTTLSVDSFQYGHAVSAQQKIVGIHAHWFDKDITIMEAGAVFSKAMHLSTRTIINVYNGFLDEANQKALVGFTTSYLDVEVGDRLAVVIDLGALKYAKLNGVVGWYRGEVVFEQ